MIHTRPRRSIPLNSPFAALRQIPLVGPTFVEEPDDIDPFEIEWEVQRMFPAVPMPEDHPAARYFEHSQNDGIVIGFETTPHQAILTFGHHDIARLATVFTEDHINWNHVCDCFPTRLIFEEVTEMFVIKQIEQGVYQRPRSPVQAHDIGRIWSTHVAPGEFDVVIDLRGAIEGGYRRSKRGPESWYINDYDIFLTCRDIRVEENLRDLWIQMFDGHHLDVFDRFQSVWPVPRWGMNDFDHWIATGELPRPYPRPPS
jgi:hypothetical protein